MTSEAILALEHWFGRFSLNAWREGIIEPSEKAKAKNALAIEDAILVLEAEVAGPKMARDSWATLQGKEQARAERAEVRLTKAIRKVEIWGPTGVPADIMLPILKGEREEQP